MIISARSEVRPCHQTRLADCDLNTASLLLLCGLSRYSCKCWQHLRSEGACSFSAMASNKGLSDSRTLDLWQNYCETGDYNALEGAILNCPDLSEHAIIGVVYDLVSGGDMPPHLADVILRRWKEAGHLANFKPEEFLATASKMMVQQDMADRAYFPDGLEVFVVNTPDVPFAAKGVIVRNETCPGLGMLFVSLSQNSLVHGLVASENSLVHRLVAVKKRNILLQQPRLYFQFSESPSSFGVL